MSRIRIITGHFGSGKTEIAVNLAMESENSVIVDMDTVNPYFRTADVRDKLKKSGVKVILPHYAGSNVDMPTLPAEILSVFAEECDALFDVGGDDDGAAALGVYNRFFKEKDYELYFVICQTRPLTKTTEEIIAVMDSIERVSRLKITHLINNTHLSDYTDAEKVLEGQLVAQEVSRQTGVPILFTAVKKELVNELSSKIDNPVYGLTLYINLPFGEY